MERQGVSRREFLKLAGAAPVAAGLVTGAAPAPDAAGGPGGAPSPGAAAPATGAAAPAQVPTRAFGASGVRVSCLALGDAFHAGLLYLKQAVSLGVTHWDTAHSYGGGESEKGIGRYLEKVPGDRSRLFVSTKGDPREPQRLTEQLEESLARMRTSYVDLYYVHDVADPRRLQPDLLRWGDEQKKRGRIRLFGVSTHENMTEILLAATRLPSIDAVMVKYNYRLMDDAALRLALTACAGAGKGITAMKIMGDGPLSREERAAVRFDEAEQRFVGHFLSRGFTPGQAMVHAVWENPAVASVCLNLVNTDDLHEYVAAALGRTGLTEADREQLRAHALATREAFCAGCSRRCQPLADGLPISDVMRFLTYSHRPGGLARARAEFSRLPAETRERLASADLRPAEGGCPNGLSISLLVRDALDRLA